VIVRAAVVAPVGTMTLFGVPMIEPFTMTVVLATAAAASVTVAVTGSPALAEVGVTLKATRFGASRLSAAVTLAWTSATTGVVVIVKFAEVLPFLR
jgi:hypothetical protein